MRGMLGHSTTCLLCMMRTLRRLIHRQLICTHNTAAAVRMSNLTTAHDALCLRSSCSAVLTWCGALLRVGAERNGVGGRSASPIKPNKRRPHGASQPITSPLLYASGKQHMHRESAANSEQTPPRHVGCVADASFALLQVQFDAAAEELAQR